jgi:hypothetical protein
MQHLNKLTFTAQQLKIKSVQNYVLEKNFKLL